MVQQVFADAGRARAVKVNRCHDGGVIRDEEITVHRWEKGDQHPGREP